LMAFTTPLRRVVLSSRELAALTVFRCLAFERETQPTFAGEFAAGPE
jgi:hypothetical protein